MTDLSTLRTQAAVTAAARKQTALALLEQAGKIDVVNTDEDADLAGRLARRAKQLLLDIDEERKGYTRLLDSTKQGIMADYKPAVTTLEDVEQHLKGIMDEARRREQARLDAEREERERALEAAIADGDHAQADALLTEQLSPLPEKAYMPAGTSVTRHLKVEVEDKQRLFDMVALGRLPLGLFDVNMANLRAVAREELKAGHTIPGVKAEYVEGVGLTGTR